MVLLRYLLVFELYRNNFRYINLGLLKEKYPELHTLYRALNDIQTRVPNTNKNLGEFRAWFFANYPALREAEIKSYEHLFAQLEQIEVQEGVADELFDLVTKRSQASEVARIAWDVSEGKRPFEDLQVATSLENAASTRRRGYTFVTSNLEELKNGTVLKPGLRWPLQSLNVSLGSLRVGDMGFVFARPETGKTTFISHCGTHFAKQAKERDLGPGVWFNNEEQGEKVKLRTFQSTFGYNLSQLFADGTESQSRYDQVVGDWLKLYDDSSIHRADVESICQEFKPSFIIVDQLDKIKGFDADRPDIVFGQIYQWARGLAKQYAPVIGICQASGEGEGVRWLTMDHVAEAKTSKQAEADWILGIGRTHDAGLENTRYFNISKNKLIGDHDSLPDRRHDRIEVMIRPEIARYEDIA